MKKKKTFLSLAVALFIAPLVFSAVSPKSKPVEVNAAATNTKRIWASIEHKHEWDSSGAVSYIHYWGGTPSTNFPGVPAIWDAVNDKIYYDVPADTKNVLFVRVSSGGDVWNQTADLTATGHFDNWYMPIYNYGQHSFDNNWATFTPKTTTIVQSLADSINTKAKACSSTTVTTAISTYNGLSTFEQNQFNALQVGDGFTGAQRLAYLMAFYNITTPLSVIEKTKNEDNSLMATIIIGVIGLSTLAGYYFLQRKKAVHD